jgi:pantoate--beta-alanine ligase
VGEDFDKYPRDVAKDVLAIEEGLSAAAAAQGGGGRDVETVVFAPSVRELYGDRFSTRVDIGLMADTSEAHARPQFFSGVATVVSKLFNITQPHRTPLRPTFFFQDPHG